MDAHGDSVNISPSAAKHVRSSSANSELESCGSSQLSDTSTVPSLSAYSDSVSSLSPFMSPPTTPRSPLVTTNGSRLHRFTSHEHLSSFSNSTPGLKRDWSSTSSLLQDDDDDKFTQLPVPSSRERRSSSLTYSARSRKSLSNLRKPALLNSAGIDEEHSLSNTPKGMMSPQISPLEGNKLSRRHIEASRRSAKEALEEDLRVYDASSTSGDGFVREYQISPRSFQNSDATSRSIL